MGFAYFLKEVDRIGMLYDGVREVVEWFGGGFDGIFVHK